MKETLFSRNDAPNIKKCKVVQVCFCFIFAYESFYTLPWNCTYPTIKCYDRYNLWIVTHINRFFRVACCYGNIS